jgi:hypothetical protein
LGLQLIRPIAKRETLGKSVIRRQVAHRQAGRSVLQVSLAVFLLTLLALLTANVCLIDMARNFNAKVCVAAAKVGAMIAQKGGDESQITKGIQDTINHASPGGFFVQRPSLRELRFDSVHGLPYLVVATVTAARVPAPVLVWNGTFSPDGSLLFYKTCIVSLKPAEKVKK